jgi:hypothetical protein
MADIEKTTIYNLPLESHEQFARSERERASDVVKTVQTRTQVPTPQQAVVTPSLISQMELTTGGVFGKVQPIAAIEEPSTPYPSIFGNDGVLKNLSEKQAKLVCSNLSSLHEKDPTIGADLVEMGFKQLQDLGKLSRDVFNRCHELLGG